MSFFVNFQDIYLFSFVSLDFFRGFTMFLLIAEFANLFPLLLVPELEGTPLHFIGVQLHHCDWAGLHFWELIQPFFMFIVGVAGSANS